MPNLFTYLPVVIDGMSHREDYLGDLEHSLLSS